MVYVVNWGASQSDYQLALAFAQKGINSPWSQTLGAYGVGPGTYAGTWVDTTPPPQSYSIAQIFNEANHAIAANNWQSGANTQVWMLVGITLEGSAEACGNHNAEATQMMGHYSVLDSITIVTDAGNCGKGFVAGVAHEYAEAATDPDTQDGVVGTVTPGQPSTSEVGDVCETATEALSPVGWLPMIYVPFLGCTWGEWAPAELTTEESQSSADVTLPATWGQCSPTTPCHGWLYYPSGAQVPSGHRSWNDPTSGQWVIVP